ncbi:unnamed protein product, partial [Polarella glacialis]
MTSEGLSEALCRAKALHARLRARQEAQPETPGLHRVAFISLARQQSRRLQFLEQLGRFPALLCRSEWFRAVDGATLDLKAVPEGVVTAEGLGDAQTPREKVLGYVLTRGGIGLAGALHHSLELIARDPDDSHVYLLCEDDSLLAPDFPAAFAGLLSVAQLHDPWWE